MNNKKKTSLKFKLIKSPFPDDKGIIEELSHPNYLRVNMGLPLDPTPLQVAKYEICQKILSYINKNNLSEKKIAKQIGLTSAETENILFCRIEKLTLDHLIDYASKLFTPFHMGIIEAKPRLNENAQN